MRRVLRIAYEQIVIEYLNHIDLYLYFIFDGAISPQMCRYYYCLNLISLCIKNYFMISNGLL